MSLRLIVSKLFDDTKWYFNDGLNFMLVKLSNLYSKKFNHALRITRTMYLIDYFILMCIVWRQRCDIFLGRVIDEILVNGFDFYQFNIQRFLIQTLKLTNNERIFIYRKCFYLIF